VWPPLFGGQVERSATGLYDGARPSLAVLYLEDRTSDKQFAYLADALTESLIDELSGVSGLDVISQNGVVPYRGSADLDRDSVGRALGVRNLIHGFVETERDRIRVTLTVWEVGATEFGRVVVTEPKADPLALRTSVAQKAAEELRKRLGDEARLRELRAGTSDPEAWSLVQRAERRRKDADVRELAGDLAGATQELATADTLLSAAAARDARWAEPFVLRGHIAVKRERIAREDAAAAGAWLDSAVVHADSALRRERTPDALELRATAHMRRLARRLVNDQKRIDALTEAAERDLLAAVNANPRQATSLFLLSQLMSQKQDIPGANSYARRAYEADAFVRAAPAIIYRLYVTSYDIEAFAAAEEWCNTGRRRFPANPEFARCRLWLMSTKAVASPGIDAAWTLTNELVELTPPQRKEWVRREGAIATAAVIAKIARAADSTLQGSLADSARRVLERSRADRTVDPTGELIGFEAFVLTHLGDHEAAITLLQRYLVEHPDHRRGFAKVNAWWWRDLQGYERFRQLIAVQ
jgi:TolB-like protein